MFMMWMVWKASLKDPFNWLSVHRSMVQSALDWDLLSFSMATFGPGCPKSICASTAALMYFYRCNALKMILLWLAQKT